MYDVYFIKIRYNCFVYFPRKTKLLEKYQIKYTYLKGCPFTIENIVFLVLNDAFSAFGSVL